MNDFTKTLLACLALCLGFINAKAQNADAVVTEEKNNVTISDDGSYAWTLHQSVKILNERGAGHASFSVYLDKNKTLDKFQMTFADASGKVLRTFKQKDLMRSELSEGLVEDGYMMMLDETPPVYPIVAICDLTIKFKRNNIAFPVFAPIDHYNTQVEHASYDISFPENVALRYKVVNSGIKPQKDVQNGVCNLHFQMDDLKAVKNSEYGLPLDEVAPKVYFASENFSYYKTSGSLASWNELGKWNHSLFSGRQVLPEEAKAKIKQVVRGCSNDREKVEAIYKFLASTTRYVSIQLAIGGFQPMAAADVWKRGYGDCKALSNYMMALLAEVGIDSHCVAISTTKRRLLEDFPTFQQMNHMILEVPMQNDTLWVECTNPTLNLGYVHSGIAGHDALEISEKGGRVVTLPEYPDSCNLTLAEAIIDVNENGAADITVNTEYRYHRYHLMKELTTLDDNDLRKLMFAIYNLPQTEIKTCGAEDISIPFGMTAVKSNMEAHSRKFANATAARLFVPLNFFHKNFSPAADSHNANELYFPKGAKSSEKIVVCIPKGFQVEKMPQDVSISMPYAEFHSHVSLQGDKLILQNEYIRHKGVFRDAVDGFYEMEKKIAEVYAAKLVLKKI